MSYYYAEERTRVAALLRDGDALPRRRVAFRANVTERLVRAMCEEGVLEVCGQEPRNPLHGPQRGRGNPLVRLKAMR